MNPLPLHPSNAFSKSLHALPSTLRRSALGAVAFAATALTASPTFAATIALSPSVQPSSSQPPSLPRIKPDGSSVTKRALNLTPDGISLQDCVDDLLVQVPLTLSDFQTQGTLQLWASAGADCTAQTSRQSGTQLCWQLGSNVPLSLNPLPSIPVRDIIAGIADPKNPNVTQSICGTVDLTTITVYVLYFDAGQTATPAANISFTIQADTIGPPAPSGLTTLPGNTRIHVSWDAVGEGGVVALTGVNVYCDSNTSSSSSDAASTCDASSSTVEASTETSDADADLVGAETTDTDISDASATNLDASGCASGSSGEGCSSPNFTPADGKTVLPDAAFDAKYKCGGVVGNTGTSVVAESVGGAPLVNYQTYAVAVAATDAFGNVGPLAVAGCLKPEETNDFWENYKAAGGGAGGGYCAIDGVGMPMGSVSVLGVVGLAVVSAWRRRRG